MISVEPTKLWWYLGGKVRWPADIWIKCMIAAGFASYRRGSLTIRIPKGDNIHRELSSCRPRPPDVAFRRKPPKSKKPGVSLAELRREMFGDGGGRS